MRRNHPLKQHVPLRKVPVQSDFYVAKEIVSTRPSTKETSPLSARDVPESRKDERSGRYLHDDLLHNFRLHLSNSQSSSSFPDAVAESRDDYDDIGEERQCHRKPVLAKSTFSKMMHETHHFQKLVAELESILKKSGETPETNWKARILVKSAQDTDATLSRKLNVYERSLQLQNPAGLRTSQKTACLKLHRDFQRSHGALVTCLNEFETRQRVEVSQLGAKRWDDGQKPATKEDYFERTMRHREVERMNESMRQVNDIYNELAELVEGQQEKINHLESDIEYAGANTEAGANEILCLQGRNVGGIMCGAVDDCAGEEDNTILLDDELKQSPKGLRVTEAFHWYMPFETIKEDLESVKNDIVHVGKDIVSTGKRIKCANSKFSEF